MLKAMVRYCFPSMHTINKVIYPRFPPFMAFRYPSHGTRCFFKQLSDEIGDSVRQDLSLRPVDPSEPSGLNRFILQCHQHQACGTCGGQCHLGEGQGAASSSSGAASSSSAGPPVSGEQHSIVLSCLACLLRSNFEHVQKGLAEMPTGSSLAFVPSIFRAGDEGAPSTGGNNDEIVIVDDE